nr:hypothetical protein GCM10020092_037120 [Actinoplanes digitatis]
MSFAAPGFFSGGALEPGPAGIEPTEGLDTFVRRCLAEGNGAGHLSDAEQRELLRFAEASTPGLEVLRGSRRLVHADFNPKNLLVGRDDDGHWRVTAVLDWEFAFSSAPLFDVGNMLRDPRPSRVRGGLRGRLPRRRRPPARGLAAAQPGTRPVLAGRPADPARRPSLLPPRGRADPRPGSGLTT